MKKLLVILGAVYMIGLTGCATTDMAEQERIYQTKVEQERYNKMLGKTATHCHPQVPMQYVGKEGKPVPNFNVPISTCN